MQDKISTHENLVYSGGSMKCITYNILKLSYFQSLLNEVNEVKMKHNMMKRKEHTEDPWTRMTVYILPSANYSYSFM